ncbi:MAG: hypothetical protein NZ930_03635 [Candidatus Bipolaricaulota bacterium]|nr:hypothetical protein [Candidatus Bipolaricaulota bacterium]MDW8031458.1 hypothetical protein [Candidatus Bipolaricaulota bacterium]
MKPEYQELLEWAQEHTQAKSLSEAVFSAWSELKALIEERQLQALERTHGLWKDDPKIMKVFKELEEGWERWRKQFVMILSSSALGLPEACSRII